MVVQKKSQLAKEYSHINSQKYDLTWCFDLKGDLEAQYENLLIHSSNNKVFEKLLNISNIKPPKARYVRQHIIITKREKPIFGDNTLTLGPFTDIEAKKFLSRIYPKEKKEEIIKLYKVLHNYPLALAQVSKVSINLEHDELIWLLKNGKVY